MPKAPKLKDKKPVGRPRADGRPHLTEWEVYGAAAKLIARDGFAGTSIRKLASELGVTTASVLHLFKTKEDILNRLICFAAAPSLAFYERMQARSESAKVLLYKSLYEETLLVASAAKEFPALFYLPELSKPAFAPAQAVRRTMIRHYESLIKRGQERDEFESLNPSLTAEQFFQLTETSILAGAAANRLSPAEQAEATASLCLRAILKKKRSIESIVRNAAKLDDQINGHNTDRTEGSVQA